METDRAVDEFNPYAPPKSMEQEEGRGHESRAVAWRDGQLLIVLKDAVLPDRCIKCNEPAEGFQFRRTLTWANPLIYFFLLCGLIPLILIYLIFAKRGRITVGICPVHRRKRKQAIFRAWLLGLAGFALFVVAGILPDNFVAITLLGGFGLILTGILVAAFGTRILVPTRIDKDFIWLAKVSPWYLATFPDVHRS